MTLNFLVSHKLCMVLVLFLATFVHEDFAIIGGSYLVSEDQVSLVLVFMSTLCGVVAGDLGIYGLGALCARNRKLRQWAGRRFSDGPPKWLDRNLALTVIGCRFVPVSLFPTFAACGLIGVPFRRFAAFTAVSALVYVPALFAVTMLLGREATETIGSWSWAVVLAAGLVFVFVRKRLPRAIVRPGTVAGSLRLHEGMPPLPRAKVRVALQERVSEKLYYIPIVVHWLAMAVRFRGITLPTCTNPLIEAGGLLGESKIACLTMVPASMHRWLARSTSLDIRLEGRNDSDAIDRALGAARAAGLSFPLIVKPDVGWRGFGVRRIENEAELAGYLADFPGGVRLVLQEYIPHHGEAGVFYVRRPGERRGEIFSLTLRYFPFVVGDGRSTLAELVAADPRSRWKASLHCACNSHRLMKIPSAGEIVRLSVVGSNRVGGLYVDARGLVTEAMRARFDEISQGIPEFYFGRYDIRFSSIEALQAGEGFSIVEINGAGSEAIHIWDPDYPFFAGYTTLLRQQRLMFEIAAANRARGFKPLGLRELIGYQRLQARVLRDLPASA